MSNTKPMGYESWKILIAYMDPNLRFELASSIPSIRAIEKIVPLKLNSLSFKNLMTSINDTTYHLGIHRQYPASFDIPKSHQEDNDFGGIDSDLTEHGFQVQSTIPYLTPGDVDIVTSEEELKPAEEIILDDDQKKFERELDIYERALARQQEVNFELTSSERDIFPDIPSAERDPHEREIADRRYVATIAQFSRREIQEAIKKCKAELVSYYSRRDNTPSPFTPLLQLTVISPDGSQKIYRRPYTMKLREAWKLLNTTLLGGYRGVLSTRSLNIMSQKLIIRLPPGLKMKIHNLSVTSNMPSVYESLKSIIDDSSYPLDTLDLRKEQLILEHFDHPIIRNAKTLVIRFSYETLADFKEILLNLQNETVHFVHNQYEPVESQIEFIEHWIRERKEVWKSFSYEQFEESNDENLIAEIGNRGIGSICNESSAIIPLDDHRDLSVSYKKKEETLNDDEDDSDDEFFDYLENPDVYVVTLQVVPKQVV